MSSAIVAIFCSRSGPFARKASGRARRPPPAFPATYLPDASRPAVAWARRNAAANGLQDRPIRWIVEDARSYAEREIRRGRHYDGIVLDPPTFGHGSGAIAWRLEDHLTGLLSICTRLLFADGFLLLTAHTEGYAPERLDSMIGAALGRGRPTTTARGDLDIETTAGGALALGAYASVDRRAS